MSAPGDPPLELQYRPIFPSFHVLENHDRTSDVYQSFPFLPGFESISFEEQRLHDMTPPPPMAVGKVGKLSSSALRSLKAAYKSHQPSKHHDFDLLDPFFNAMWRPGQGSDTTHELNAQEDSIKAETEPETEEIRDAKRESVIECKLDVDVAAFRVYTEWVYSGQIQWGALSVNAEDIDFSSIGEAYILGEKLLDRNFKNAIVNLLLRTIVAQGKMDLTLPTLVFKETSASAPLRKLLVDIWVCYGHKDWLKPDEYRQTISATFLSDLSTAFLDLHGHDEIPKSNLSTLDTCKYHEHPDGKPCSVGRRHPREIVEPE
ncbi:unnamed protein product [Aureobasidium mustum]|uniref:BTB domain-containing protein n=1 Tax=Aureobasidium mustum TaxID=2773714 RepID=A0A9N8JKI0_9PEZI|nr:unnamed protein product [Aureobasidium mustum]